MHIYDQEHKFSKDACIYTIYSSHQHFVLDSNFSGEDNATNFTLLPEQAALQHSITYNYISWQHVIQRNIQFPLYGFNGRAQHKTIRKNRDYFSRFKEADHGYGVGVIEGSL